MGAFYFKSLESWEEASASVAPFFFFLQVKHSQASSCVSFRMCHAGKAS